MPTTTEAPETRSLPVFGKVRTSRDERRRGIRLLIISALLAGAMFAMWWLVATTNREGTHDAELLPLVALAALVPATYHLVLARYLRLKGK